MMNNAYMIRQDGEAYPVKIHLYGSTESNPDAYEETAWAAEWLYNHTKNQDTKNKCLQIIRYWCTLDDVGALDKEEILQYIDDIGYMVVSKDFINKHFDEIQSAEPVSNIDELNRDVNQLLNQEFLRARYGGRLDTQKGSREMVFRVSSSGFNWFNIIWEFVYNHKNEIDSVTICKDLESTGREDFYRHNGKEFNKMPVDEFIALSGRPIVERKIEK